MIVAVTGTPGTGKSSVCAELSRLGHEVVDLQAFVRSRGLHDGRDTARDSLVVDPAAVSRALSNERKPTPGPLFLDAHWSHWIRPLDMIVVLRCRPSELARRLKACGYDPPKVQENVEAEAVDAITIEAGEMRDSRLLVIELDTTAKPASDLAREIDAIVRNPTPGALNAHPLGSCDWSDEVISWY